MSLDALIALLMDLAARYPQYAEQIQRIIDFLQSLC
jgi:hypothetical protein